MNAMARRALLAQGCGACAAAALAGCADTSDLTRVAPGHRPAPNTDEAGLWLAVERHEEAIRRSPQVVRDPTLNAYVRDIACRLGGEYCGDIRVYILRQASFNAAMYPNGLMVVNSGLLVRARDEAELAAVVGHEIGHYLKRHSVKNDRVRRNAADFSVFLSLGLGMTGIAVAGLVQLVALAQVFAYSRDQEREADAIGIDLIRRAGYRPSAASRIWEGMIAERSADPDPHGNDVTFATHPAPDERMATLREEAARLGDAGEVFAARYHERLGPLRGEFVADELRQRRFARFLVLLDRLQEGQSNPGEVHFFYGEAFRQRARDGDARRAIDSYEQALAQGGFPAETHRGLGLARRLAGEHAEAARSFQRYLDAKPDANDRAIIESYLRGTP